MFLRFPLAARSRKRRAAKEEQREAAALAFHLALQPPESNARLIAACLRAAPGFCPGADQKRGGGRDPSSLQNKNAARAAAEEGQRGAQGASPAPQTAGGAGCAAEAEADGTVRAGDMRWFLLFRLDKVTADELRAAMRAEGRRGAMGGAFTPEAEKLAAAFGIELWRADAVCALVRAANRMPSPLLAPPPPAKKRKTLRPPRSAWRGCALSGGALLLFSLWAVFPLYYLIAGGLLLAVGVLIKIFGK